MTQEKLQEILDKHKKWLTDGDGGEHANLQDANLQDADLRGADLQDANLRGANLFRACLPLWCGGLNWTVGRLQMAQFAYHFCSMNCDDAGVKQLQQNLFDLANEFADSRQDMRNKKFEVKT